MTTLPNVEAVTLPGTLPFAGVIVAVPGLPAPGQRETLWKHALPNVVVRLLARFLAVPLGAKLAGVNAAIILSALAAAVVTYGGEREHARPLALIGGALAISLVVSIGLVLAALQPVRRLEQAAERVSGGDLAARVQSSALADPNIARVGQTMNRVLDDLVADRARARRLASEVIRAGDRQRALIGRELSESTAQVLAALTFETSALASGSSDPDMKERLEMIRSLTSEALDHVGTLAQTVHPRVLDDLGLVVALKSLARRVRETSPVHVDVYTDSDIARIPDGAATMLYRVTEEAVANAVRHGWAERICIRLSATGSAVQLIVSDDGRGFDVQAARSEPGIGLFMMQERALIAGAAFSLASGADSGTIVRVVLPVKEVPA